MAKAKNPLQRTFVRGTPFVQYIVDFPTPSKFKAPVVTLKYDGKTDPVLHIEQYQDAVDIYAVPDEMRCRAFSGNLTGSAQIWYNNLPQGKISTFLQLAELFIGNFCFGAKPVK